MLKRVVFDQWNTHLGDRRGFGYGNGFFGGIGWVRIRDGGHIAPDVIPINLELDVLTGTEVADHVARTGHATHTYVLVSTGSGVYTIKSDGTTNSVGLAGAGGGDTDSVPVPGEEEVLICTPDGIFRVDLSVPTPTMAEDTGFPGTIGAQSISLYEGRFYATGGGVNGERVYYGAINDFSSATWTATGSGSFDLPRTNTQRNVWIASSDTARIVGTLRDGIYFTVDGVIYRLARDPEIGSLTQVTTDTFLQPFQAGDVLLGFSEELQPAMFDGVSVTVLSENLRLIDTPTAGALWRGAMTDDQRTAVMGNQEYMLVLSDGVWTIEAFEDIMAVWAVCPGTETREVLIANRRLDGDTNLSTWKASNNFPVDGDFIPGSRLELPTISDVDGLICVREIHIDGWWIDGSTFFYDDVALKVEIKAVHVAKDPEPAVFTKSYLEAEITEGSSWIPVNTPRAYPFRLTVNASVPSHLASGYDIALFDCESMMINRITVVYDLTPWTTA